MVTLLSVIAYVVIGFLQGCVYIRKHGDERSAVLYGGKIVEDNGDVWAILFFNVVFWPLLLIGYLVRRQTKRFAEWLRKA